MKSRAVFTNAHFHAGKVNAGARTVLRMNMKSPRAREAYTDVDLLRRSCTGRKGLAISAQHSQRSDVLLVANVPSAEIADGLHPCRAIDAPRRHLIGNFVFRVRLNGDNLLVPILRFLALGEEVSHRIFLSCHLSFCVRTSPLGCHRIGFLF